LGGGGFCDQSYKNYEKDIKDTTERTINNKALTKTHEPFSLPEIQQSIYKNNCVQLYLQES